MLQENKTAPTPVHTAAAEAGAQKYRADWFPRRVERCHIIEEKLHVIIIKTHFVVKPFPKSCTR